MARSEHCSPQVRAVLTYTHTHTHTHTDTHTVTHAVQIKDHKDNTTRQAEQCHVAFRAARVCVRACVCVCAEPCVGVELRCEADVARVLGPAAHVLGGQHTSSPEVGALFHKLGLEGAGAH